MKLALQCYGYLSALQTKVFGKKARKSHRFTIPNNKLVISSVNRYERKKGLIIAFEALALVRKQFPETKLRFIHGGGYDPQNSENVDHFEELQVVFAVKIPLNSRIYLEICW